jgi:hypothetical protein
MINVNSTVSFVNTEHGASTGTKRAILVGINCTGTKSQLSGCHNHVLMERYLMAVHGFEETNMVIFMDDGKHITFTCVNMLKAFQDLAQSSRADNKCVVHYSGHGGYLKDDKGDEPNPCDETLCPLDYDTAGQIRDDDLLKSLVVQVTKGALLMCLMEHCVFILRHAKSFFKLLQRDK